jgi:hypothetical protein
LSLFGSLVGVSFSLSDMEENKSFSVGMDCPNSIMGGRNSIRLPTWDSPSEVAKLVMDCHDGEDSCRIAGGNVDVIARRAAELGSINLGVSLVTQRP